MWIDRHDRQLRALGVPSDRPDVLELLPLVYVAWADGTLDDVERERLDAVAEWLGVSEASRPAMRRWLAVPPTRAEVIDGCNLLRHLADELDEPHVDGDDLYALVRRAEWIAQRPGQLPDEPWSLTPEAERAIDEISQLLGVSLGETWAELFDDLRSTPHRAGAPS